MQGDQVIVMSARDNLNELEKRRDEEISIIESTTSSTSTTVGNDEDFTYYNDVYYEEIPQVTVSSIHRNKFYH